MVWRRLLGHLPVNIVQVLVGFGGVAVYTRLMSPDDFGRYTLFLTTMMMGHTLTLSWVEAAAFRFLPAAKREGTEAAHFATLLGLSGLAMAIAATLAAAALGVASLFMTLTDEVLTVSLFAAFAAGLRTLTMLGRETDKAELAVLRYSTLESCFLLTGFLVGAAAVAFYGRGAEGPLIGLVIGAGLIATGDLWRFFKRARGGRFEAERGLAYARFGLPLAAALGLDLMVQTAARFTLAHLEGEAAAGAYAAAYSLSARMIDLFFIWAALAATPLTLQAYETRGRDATLAIARRAAAMYLAIAVPAAVGLSLVARPFAHLMIGEGLREEAIALIPWLAFAGVGVGLTTHYFSDAFQLARRTGLRAVLMLAPAAATIALTALLVPIYGVVGAAVAAAIAAWTGALVLAAVGRRWLPLPIPWVDAGKVLLAVAAMAAIIRLTPAWGGVQELALKAFVGGAIYGLCALALDIAGARVGAATVWRRLSGKVDASRTADPKAP